MHTRKINIYYAYVCRSWMLFNKSCEGADGYRMERFNGKVQGNVLHENTHMCKMSLNAYEMCDVLMLKDRFIG